MSLAVRLRDHYRHRWGEPSRTGSFDFGDEVFVEICKWDSDRPKNTERVTLYATIGASLHPMKGADPSHRIELVVGFDPPEDDVAGALAVLASFPRRQGTSLEHGHTVPFGEPLWAGSGMRAFLVLRPNVSDLIPPMDVENVHVDFLQAIPIYPSELEAKKTDGLTAFMDAWEEKKVPFWNPRRSPVPP